MEIQEKSFQISLHYQDSQKSLAKAVTFALHVSLFQDFSLTAFLLWLLQPLSKIQDFGCKYISLIKVTCGWVNKMIQYCEAKGCEINWEQEDEALYDISGSSS